MRKFLTQNTRRTPLEGPHDLMWRFFWCGFHEQMDVIGLDCQIDYRPTVFTGHFFANFTKAFGNLANQHFFTALG